MIKTTHSLGSVCEACGTDRKQRLLAYDPNSFMPYCSHPYICNEDHPNSTQNLIDRGDVRELLNYDDALERYKEHLLTQHASPDVVQAIRNMIEKPTLFRVLEPEIAEFVVKLNKTLEHSSVSETIRHILRCMMNSEAVYVKDFAEYQDAQDKTAKIEDIKQELLAAPTEVTATEVVTEEPANDRIRI